MCLFRRIFLRLDNSAAVSGRASFLAAVSSDSSCRGHAEVKRNELVACFVVVLFSCVAVLTVVAVGPEYHVEAQASALPQ
jgi:hypothetical protein